MRYFYIIAGAIILVFISSNIYAQKVYPLTRNDSAVLVKYDKLYNEKFELAKLKEASNYLNLSAMLYWERNHFADAEKTFLKSLEINKKLANQNGIAMINNNLAMIYADKQEYKKSLDYFEKTLIARRVGKEKIGIISALINQSVVYNKLEQYDASIKNLEEALDLAREMNDPKQMRSCYGMLSETYQKSGNIKKSMYYYDYFKTFNDIVTSKKIKKTKKELEIERLRAKLAESESEKKELELVKKKYELIKKDKKLAESNSEIKYLIENLSKKELALKILKTKAQYKELKAKQELERKQKTIKWILMISIFIVIITLLLLYAYRQKRMANKQLEYKNNEILQQNEEILQQKEEILTQSEQLQITYARLKELDIMKQGLAAMLVHDLKNPLNSIINLSDKKEIINAGNQMLRIVSNILDVQKYENTDIPLVVKNQLLTQIINKVIQQVDYLALYKNIKITNNVTNNIYLRVDEEITERVFINLLTNSIKFTPENGTVSIDAKNDAKNKNFVQIAVSDNGIGIRAEKIQVIFDKFIQIDIQKSGSSNSTGLGLTFCKMAVEAHGGKISVASVPNVKTTFNFNLPRGIDLSTKKRKEEAEHLEEQDKLYILNKEELVYLVPYIKRFKQHDFFEISALQKINDSIDENFSNSIKEWKNKMDIIIYRCNENMYNSILADYADV